jgi:hypothetical protein
MLSPSSEVLAADSPKPVRAKWGLGTIFATVLVVALILAASLWLYQSSQADARLAEIVARVRARGSPLTTFELNEYYRPAPERPDMTIEIWAALGICETSTSQRLVANLPIVGQGPEPPLPPQAWRQLEETEEFLSRVSSALATFRNVARHRGTVRFPVDFTAGVATLLPQTQSMRSGSRIISMQFYVDLHRGRTAEAVARLLDQLALADALDQEPLVVSQFVRLALMGAAFNNIQQLLQCADLSDSEIAEIQLGLRKMEYTACLKQALIGERALAYSSCVDPRLAEGGASLTLAESRKLSTRAPSRMADAIKSLELYERIFAGADKSLYHALQEGIAAEAEVKVLSESAWSRYTYAMTILLCPAHRQAVTAFARSAAKRDCADVALAAELYRLRHGSWPGTIEALVPEFLPSAPLDPFTNLPLKIVVTAEKFIVYSIGSDGVDNGGNLGEWDGPNPDFGFFVPLRRRESGNGLQ